MKIALVFAAVAVTLGAACDTSDVLDAYAQARAGGSNCDRLIDTLSPFFFNGQAPSADVLEPLCGDECSLLFMWNLYESGCADQSQARAAFQQVIDTCECRVDAFFVARGGRCITACTGPVCVGNEAGSHYDEPYLSTEDGHKLQMHVMGATLTLESESSTNRGEG